MTSITRRNLLGRLGVGAAVAAAGPALAESALASVLSPSTGSSGDMLRLHRNENAYGPSPRVMLALIDSMAGLIQRFPDAASDTLRRTLAGLHDVAPDRIVTGNGSTDLLRMAASAMLGPGTKVVTALPTFDALQSFAEQRGATVAALPLTEQHGHDLDRMLAAVDASTRLVYICNPNNPTGTLTRRQDLERFLRALRSDVYVVIDEAYHHYVDPTADYASFIDRPIDDPRIIVLRSFSKLFGLAGARVGYAVAEPSTARLLSAGAVADGVNALAAKAATTAIDDRDHLQWTLQRNANERQEFFNQANARMLRVIDSQANFVMLNTNRPGAEIVAHFRSNRILVAGPYPRYDTYIRVSLGTSAEIGEFWRVWDLLPSHHMSMK
jgi:histidinol-phosphate aminotransferase